MLDYYEFHPHYEFDRCGPKAARLAFIVCKDQRTFIYTVRFDGETEKVVKEKFDAALAKLPFETKYDRIDFSFPDAVENLILSINVIRVDPFPNIGTLVIDFGSFSNLNDGTREYFLPRDQATGNFIGLADQTECLELLRVK